MTSNPKSHSSSRRLLSSRFDTTSKVVVIPFEELQPDPPFWTKTSWLQLGYGIWANLTLIGVGLTFGFSAVAVPQLRIEDSPINITTNDETTITSVLTLAAPVGCVFSGIVMDKCGRRIALVLCQVPMTFGWFYIAYAKRARDIIVGRIITGVGIGLAIGAPRSYTTEISLPNMRGVIGAIPNLATSIGLTVQAVLGSFLEWTIICYVCGTFTAVLMLANYFLPETPFYVILKSSAFEARSVLTKFRSKNYNIDGEVKDLNDFKRTNNIHSLSTSETVKAIFKPSSCKPFAIIMFYSTLMQLVGVTVVIMWSVEILEHCQSSIDSHLGNIILGISRIISGLATSVVLYKIGRRPIALISAVGLGVVSLLLGFYLHKFEEKSIYPLLFLIGYITFATLGYYTLPFLMMSEILPLQVRGILSSVVLSTMMLSMFGTNHIYSILRNKFGLKNTFLVYGAISLIGAIVLYFILPETKSLTLAEIEEYYNSRRPTLVSQREVMTLQLQGLSRMAAMSKPNQLHDDRDHSEHINLTNKQSQLNLAIDSDHESFVGKSKYSQRNHEKFTETDSENVIKKSEEPEQEKLGSKSKQSQKELVTNHKEVNKQLDVQSVTSDLDEDVRKYEDEQNKRVSSILKHSQEEKKANDNQKDKNQNEQSSDSQKDVDKEELNKSDTNKGKSDKNKKPGSRGIVFTDDDSKEYEPKDQA